MYWRRSARWLTSPRCSSRTSIVATVVSASRRPVIARWTSVTDSSSLDQSTRMTVSCDAVRRGGAAAFRGMPEYYTRRRRTASQGGSPFDQRIFRVVGPTVRQKRSSAGCYCEGSTRGGSIPIAQRRGQSSGVPGKKGEDLRLVRPDDAAVIAAGHF